LPLGDFRLPIARHRTTILAVALVLYVLALAVAVADDVWHLGLFPTRLERMARSLIARFDGDDEARRQAAAEELLTRIEAFVAIPELIRALDAPSPRTRALALDCLQHLTQTTQGYDPAAPPADRRAAIARWRAWWTAHKHQF
jgi:hypothetical protein